MLDESDENLIELVKRRDQKAFETLVRRHSQNLYRLAYRFVFNEQLAEDIVQAAFLKIWEKPSRFNPKAQTAFKTWLYRVTINQCLDIKKKKTPLFQPESQLDTLSTKTNGFDGDKKRWAQIWIEKLPENQQTALNLCSFEGHSQKEAAQILQISVKALESLLSRAKATLKEKAKQWMKKTA